MSRNYLYIIRLQKMLHNLGMFLTILKVPETTPFAIVYPFKELSLMMLSP